MELLTQRSLSQSAAWKQLTTAQQNAVNLILSWGFGGFESPSKNKVHYYYATQLLIFEIVAGKRNASTFDAVSGKPLLTPAHTMTETSSAETTVANVTNTILSYAVVTFATVVSAELVSVIVWAGVSNGFPDTASKVEAFLLPATISKINNCVA